MLLLAGCLAGTSIAQVPLGSAFGYQGQLREAGALANGLFDMQVCLFDDAVDPVPLACSQPLDNQPVQDGIYSIVLDFGDSAFTGEERFLELRVRPADGNSGYTILAPRQLVRAIPEALNARHAGSAVEAAVAPWSGLTGVPAGFADAIDDDSGGTVTSITAGAGLEGGVITGVGTLGIAPAGVGLVQIDVTQVQARVSGSCSAGEYLRAIGQDGSVQCGSAGTVTQISAGTGLSGGVITDTGTIAIAPGGVGLAQIDTSQVQARLQSGCPSGFFLRGIGADGAPQCDEAGGINSIAIVDEPDNVGVESSIAIGADGLPVISYWGVTASTLRVAHCDNVACTGFPSTVTVDAAVGGVGRWTSIAIGNDGFPVISYYDEGGQRLRVAKCAAADCTGMPTITIVDDPANSVGFYTSIAVPADGRPVVSYHDMTAGALKVARCGNAACTGTATLTTVDDSANVVGLYTSVAIGADGLPVIAYHDSTAQTLKVAKCSSLACTGATTISVVDGPVAGSYSSLTIAADGLPVISYHAGSDLLRVAKCTDPACASPATINTIADASGSVGTWTSIATGVDGFPVVSYWNESFDSVRVAKCLDAACATTHLTTLDDPAGNTVSAGTSIAIGSDGRPVVTYFDSSITALKLARCGTSSCR